jgi:hypothetical protein
MMMRKKLILAVAASVVVILTLLTWYKFHYSMDVAESFEVNAPEQKIKVLIATQGSDFKDAVVAGVVDYLKHKPVYIKVIDTSSLPQVTEAQWHAIVVIHTWENLKPPAEVAAYFARANSLNKVVTLTTSGNSSYKMDGIHAISAASEMKEVAARVADINNRLEAILNDFWPEINN